MSQYYRPNRTTNLYNPKSKDPFKLSRSKIDLFLECPRCFYLDRRLGIGRPPGFPFNLNTAVDTLLKKEFDIHRAVSHTHPLMKAYGLDLIPFSHQMLDEWRENFKGVQFLHKKTNLIITGAVDDIWTDASNVPVKEKKIYVVDYKSTSKESEVNINADWQIGYKRQMEVYQWLLRQNGFAVSDTGYFVYCNGKTDRQAFDAKLEFDIVIISYQGDDAWVEKTIVKAHQCLKANKIPVASADCDYCGYINAREKVE